MELLFPKTSKRNTESIITEAPSFSLLTCVLMEGNLKRLAWLYIFNFNSVCDLHSLIPFEIFPLHSSSYDQREIRRKGFSLGQHGCFDNTLLVYATVYGLVGRNNSKVARLQLSPPCYWRHNVRG